MYLFTPNNKFVTRKALRRKFSTDVKCKKILNQILKENLKVYKLECDNIKCNGSLKKVDRNFEIDFVRYCKVCKKKYFVTKNTLFFNVRFGMVKAFQIAIDVEFHFKHSTVEIAKRYSITQRTASVFIRKVKKDEGFIQKLFEQKSNIQTKHSNDNMLKLTKFLDSIK